GYHRLPLPSSHPSYANVQNPFPIVMVSVMDRSLLSYARKHIIRRDESDYNLLTDPGFSLADYREWHAGEVEELTLLRERV
ncbi:hypothetical protein VPJ68_16565, partial [Parabacteroides distasonis]